MTKRQKKKLIKKKKQQIEPTIGTITQSAAKDIKTAKETKTGGPPLVPEGTVFRLNSVKSTRRYMALLYKLYVQNDINETTFKNSIYFMTQFLSYLRTEQTTKIEERIEALEIMIEDSNNNQIREILK